MDFEKLENISWKLAGVKFKGLQGTGLVLLILQVYKDIYTIEEAREIMDYVKGN